LLWYVNFKVKFSLSEIHFQNVQRFCYHSRCDSIIFSDRISNHSNSVVFSDHISNHSNSYISSSLFCTVTSIVIFYQFPSASRSRIPHKCLISSQPRSNKTFAPTLLFLSQIDRLWNKIVWQLSFHFRQPWRIKESDFTRYVITRTLSKISKRNLVYERILVDRTLLVGLAIDRSSFVI